MNNFSSYVVGKLLGACLSGFGLLLFTTKSGEDLRDNIKKETQKIVDDVKAAIESRQKELIEELDNLRHGKAIKLETHD